MNEISTIFVVDNNKSEINKQKLGLKEIPTMLVVDDNTTIINQVLYKKLNNKMTRQFSKTAKASL